MTSKDIVVEIKDIPGTKNAAQIKFKGDLTSQCIKTLADIFDELDNRSGFFIIAEMSAVSQISSAALGEFMGGRKRLIDKGGDLVFASISLELRSKLNIMGANKIFRFYTDTRSAVKAYNWEFELHPEQLHLTFPPFLKFVPPIRSLISRVAKQKGYGNRDSFRIETIVDEVCNNAIEHGLQGQNQSVEIKVKIDPTKIEIDVTSISDPEKMPSLKALLRPKEEISPDLKSGEKRGRGLALIKMLSNELSVKTNESGTSVHVKKLREE